MLCFFQFLPNIAPRTPEARVLIISMVVRVCNAKPPFTDIEVMTISNMNNRLTDKEFNIILENAFFAATNAPKNIPSAVPMNNPTLTVCSRRRL